MRAIHRAGLIMWRGGILLLGVTAAIEIMHALLRFMDVPRHVELGLTFILAGLALVIVSLIMERVRDARSEGYLHE